VNLPEELLQSLEGLPGFDRNEFVSVHQWPQSLTSIRLNPRKPCRNCLELVQEAVPWSKWGYYLKERPSFTFDPEFHAGCYYVQEASSMFLEQALTQSVDLSQPLRILDLSAAPGGKSTNIESLIAEGSLLVSNEVIRGRAKILNDNIVRWGARNAVVTSSDPAVFSTLPQYFDVLVVDAPCSGSGLFRRDEDAILEWSESHVQLCSQRQQRIVADAWPALKGGGILIYSTCSYSQRENEDILEWLQRELGAEAVSLRLDEQWNIEPFRGGYRFWPHRVKGEGFFLAVMRKPGQTQSLSYRFERTMEQLSANERKQVAAWMNTENFELMKRDREILAWPESVSEEMSIVSAKLRVVYSGVAAGEMARDKFIPAHALAMSGLVNASVPRKILDDDQAIRYLRKDELQLTLPKGWQLVTTRSGHPLGWINVLSSRLNNYYPKQLRILKDR